MCQFKLTARVTHTESSGCKLQGRGFSAVIDIDDCWLPQLDLACLKYDLEMLFIRRIQKDVDKQLWRFQTTVEEITV